MVSDSNRGHIKRRTSLHQHPWCFGGIHGLTAAVALVRGCTRRCATAPHSLLVLRKSGRTVRSLQEQDRPHHQKQKCSLKDHLCQRRGIARRSQGAPLPGSWHIRTSACSICRAARIHKHYDATNHSNSDSHGGAGVGPAHCPPSGNLGNAVLDLGAPDMAKEDSGGAS